MRKNKMSTRVIILNHNKIVSLFSFFCFWDWDCGGDIRRCFNYENEGGLFA